MSDPFIDFQQEEFMASTPEEDLELSPVQTRIWDEYDDAIRERRDRLGRRQIPARFYAWLRRQYRDGDVLFYAWAAAILGTGALLMKILMRVCGVSF